MRKIPKKISILGREYKIKQGVNLIFNGVPVLGLCDSDKKVIYIEKNQSPEGKFATLCHECTHGFLYISGLDQKLSDSENELYCQLFTALFEDILKATK